jgi:hypothetical protein
MTRHLPRAATTRANGHMGDCDVDDDGTIWGLCHCTMHTPGPVRPVRVVRLVRAIIDRDPGDEQ